MAINNMHIRTGINDHMGMSAGELKRSYRKARLTVLAEQPWEPNKTPIRSALERLLDGTDTEPWQHHDEPADWLVALQVNALTLIHQTSVSLLGELVNIGSDSSSEPVPMSSLEHVKPQCGETLMTRLEQHILRIAACESGDVPYGAMAGSISELDAVFPSRSDRAFIGRLALKAGRAAENALALACVFAPFWIRPLQEWKGMATAGSEWIPSLLEHLFVRYPVPRFLYSNWQWSALDKSWQACFDHKTYRWDGFREIRPKWICWLILMGQGVSLKEAGQRFYWRIPPGFVQRLFDVPANISGEDGCLWAEVLRIGGSSLEAQRLIQSGILPFRMDVTEPPFFTTFIAFWRNTVHWMVRYRDEIAKHESMLLAMDDVRGLFRPADPLLDWAFHMYTEQDRRWRGAAFSWNGRKPAHVFSAIRDYRRVINAPALKLSWKTHNWDWKYQENPGNDWAARELSTGQDLLDETRAMHHCAVMYAEQCAAGTCVVASLCRNGRRVLTIEVDPKTGSLKQARGVCNRPPTATEDSIVHKWLTEAVNS